MTTLSKYSVAIYPSEEVISLVKEMKETLFRAIGWYHSKNSVAHISIGEFYYADEAIEKVTRQLSRITDSLKPVTVKIDRFGSFENNRGGVFFLAPNEVSREQLKGVMKFIQNTLLVGEMVRSQEPHITIARQLDSKEKLNKAIELFTEVETNFYCDRIVLRRLDEKIQQYVVVSEFQFHNNPIPQASQISLF